MELKPVCSQPDIIPQIAANPKKLRELAMVQFAGAPSL